MIFAGEVEQAILDVAYAQELTLLYHMLIQNAIIASNDKEEIEAFGCFERGVDKLRSIHKTAYAAIALRGGK